jgi:phage baseplate assembly protein V
VVLWGIASGDARLWPGARIALLGVAPALEGRYVLTSVTHTLDERLGFVSKLSTCPPPPRPRAQHTLVTPGVVTQVDDPDELGRVRVTLPTYADVETDWLAVVIPGAGPDKGLVALPDTGDQVLVLCDHDDPSRGIVLGGLYGTEQPPDSGVVDGAVRRYTLLTPGGRKVQLDDERGLIRLEDASGSFVELSGDRVVVHAAADLTIEAPGKTVVVQAANIDFRRG